MEPVGRQARRRALRAMKAVRRTSGRAEVPSGATVGDTMG
jgi:hypothetical protein